ncbi:hypothetical protein BLNAU_14130 [Blattamonas nauphoetae]|uniref:Uncharacterized protein n=1 Tax=Blattamonas nauphoetae TaxID=2049346 RepID=A0ABQ9XIA8_9EUKA|nr:hypothetical protein BLNAU_14130 [Blattamonas nauphoetae]
MLYVTNSTVSLAYLSFDCSQSGASISHLASSSLTLSGCKIVSNSESSPFCIGDSAHECSVSLVDCSHTSAFLAALLPLVSLGESFQATDSQIPCFNHPIVAFVSAHGLSVLDSQLVLGTGPLFSFSDSPTTLTQQSLSQTISTTLSSAYLYNSTSPSTNLG